MNDKTYNGWSNYETWLVALWLDNDAGSNKQVFSDSWDALDEAEGNVAKATGRMAGLLQDMHDEARPDTGPGLFHDLLSAALSEVNWREIARNCIDSVADEWFEAQEKTEEDEDDQVSDESRSYGPWA